LNEELSKGRKDEVEALLVIVPHALLGRSQVKLWVDILVVHDRWRRDAEQWCKTDQPTHQEQLIQFLSRIDTNTKSLTERMSRMEKELGRVNEKISLATEISHSTRYDIRHDETYYDEDMDATMSDACRLSTTGSRLSAAGQTISSHNHATRSLLA